MSEQTEFLKELDVQQEDSVLDKPLTESTESTEEVETSEEIEQKAKNRRERRLLEKNQQLREEVLMTNARLQGINEARQFQSDTNDDPIKAVRAIYGDDTPEKKQASDILESTLRKIQEATTQQAFDALKEQQASESRAVVEEEQNLDTMMEGLEDDHNADFSNESTRKGFLDLLERVSPKDRDGNIIEYADADTTWELYSSLKEKSTSRAKELSSRSMTRSGSMGESKIADDSTLRYLKENGII
jgi:hypothetical protein